MSSHHAYQIRVSNISNQTSEEELRTFFGFCGKINHVSVEPADGSTKSALITFDSDMASQTARLIDNTKLNGNLIHIEPTGLDSATTKITPVHSDGRPFSQSEKPRTRILAEYLAYGYHISDQIIEKGIEFDKTNGISAAFQRVLKNFDDNFASWDNKHHVSERAVRTDEKHHFLDQAKHALNSLESYFEKALGTKRGLKLRQFYEEGNKSVHDVHNEAKHLASLMGERQLGHDKKSVSNPEREGCKCDSVAAYCTCHSGHCQCNNCSKNIEPLAPKITAT